MIVLLATLKGWNISQTHQSLTGRDPIWRGILGIRLSGILPRRTLSDRWSHPLVQRWQQRVAKRMFRRLLNQRNLYVVSIDMSDLPSELYDALANWGFCGKGYFHGYKLHLVVTRDGVPLGLVVTKANRRETAVTDRLLARVAHALTDEQVDSLFFLIGGTAYDSNPAADQAKTRLSAQMIAPANPRNSQELKGELTRQTKKRLKERGTNRDKAILLYESRRGKHLFRKCRITIEQVIDQLSDYRIGFVEFARFRRECRTLSLPTPAFSTAINCIVVLYVKSLHIWFSDHLSPRL